MSEEVASAPTEEVEASVVEEATAEPEVDESVLEPEDTAQSIDVPDGGRLVPIGAVARARAAARDAKAELAKIAPDAANAATFKAQLEQSQAQVQAYEALIQQQAAGQPQKVTEPPPETAEERAELEALARDLVLVKPDGAGNQVLDMDAARRHMKLIERVADRKAAAKVEAEFGPMRQQGVVAQSAHMLARAKATEINGQRADPAVLDQLWQRLDASVTSTEEGAKWVTMAALGMSVVAKPGAAAARTPTDQFAKSDPPLYTERAGGRDTPVEVKMEAADQKLAKELGLTDKEYAASYSGRSRR